MRFFWKQARPKWKAPSTLSDVWPPVQAELHLFSGSRLRFTPVRRFLLERKSGLGLASLDSSISLNSGLSHLLVCLGCFLFGSYWLRNQLAQGAVRKAEGGCGFFLQDLANRVKDAFGFESLNSGCRVSAHYFVAQAGLTAYSICTCRSTLFEEKTDLDSQSAQTVQSRSRLLTPVCKNS